ncbi:cytochrome P450 84A1-like [Andrographis paniculata]|uniref:cytochrome P450 84A1-like n=1 Tax=Andrographis paniculata TaxID=175694 RepID=UPI0021E8F69C|nr:cytochrome P450 84A1-like [Andrographis paniculata]
MMIALFHSFELSSLLVTITILTIAILSFLLYSRHVRKPYPPGPKGWPVLGCIAMASRLSHHGLAKLAARYGDIVHIRIGFLHVISITGSNLAQQVLQVQDHIFSNRPANTAVTYLTYARSDLAFAHYNPYWRQMRKLCVTKLFSPRRVESWDSIRIEVDEMITAVASKAGAAVNIGELVFKLTQSIVYRAAFGSSLPEGQDEFIKILQEFSELFGSFNLADFFPGLGWVDPRGIKSRMREARAALDRFIDAVIAEHEVGKKVESCRRDMVDELLSIWSEDDKVFEDGNGSKSSFKLTRNNIKAVIMDVMFGGTETVASGIEWTLSELLRNPQHLKTVQQELADVVGQDRQVEEADFKNLPYLNCCIKEALRLHPPIPILLHETAVAATVDGYHIPKRSRVMINVWAISRDERVWEDPEEFKPERFLKDGAPDFNGRHFEFITFGSGRRSCPGMQLGLFAVEMAVARLLHGFSWELPDGMSPEKMDMGDVFGLAATRSRRLVAVPNPRL